MKQVSVSTVAIVDMSVLMCLHSLWPSLQSAIERSVAQAKCTAKSLVRKPASPSLPHTYNM